MMLATLAAALSLAAAASMDVPYLPQTDALCGGAAAAMVLRYWGDTHADAEEFARLVDRRAGGIRADVLARALGDAGWRTTLLEGSFATLTTHLEQHRPAIVLLADRRSRYHYVVVTGIDSTAVTIHDPSWGPSRKIGRADFERLWSATDFWGLVVLPHDFQTPSQRRAAPAPPRRADHEGPRDPRCDALLASALKDVRREGIDRAEAILAPLREQCPAFAAPWGELAGVRFAQRRWSEAASLAREAVDRDPTDAYAFEVLASSAFMQDDQVGALKAWNRIDEPRVNLVRIEGIRHARYQAIAEALAIRPNMLLTADAFERARRRLDELPDRSSARLGLRPELDGFASVDVVVSERAVVPHSVADWAGAALGAAVGEEVGVSAPGTTGQGEVWSAQWRWWANRPRVGVAFAAPRVAGLPGVWRVDASWEQETYDMPFGAPLLRSARTHGGLTVSDWLANSIRYSLNVGFDAWSGDRKAASIGASLERRWFGDRAAITLDASRWLAADGSPPFNVAAATVNVTSSAKSRRWVAKGAAGVQRASDFAPMTLWPGAGGGYAREPLLRAHPLLHDGVIAPASNDAVFGRSLAFGSVEGQRWYDTRLLARVAVAAFVDVARAARRQTRDASPAQVDAGGGLRITIPGTPGVFRVDVARGLHDGANAFTVGWQILDRVRAH